MHLLGHLFIALFLFLGGSAILNSLDMGLVVLSVYLRYLGVE